MAKVTRMTNRCPVCEYEYQVSKFFKDEQKTRRKVVLKISTEKKLKEMSENEKLALISELNMANYELDCNGKISESFKSKFKIIKESYIEEVFDKEEVTKGEKAFKKIEYLPSQYDICYGGPAEPVEYIGMFCPKCGVFLNINTCTKESEEKNK